MEREGKREGGRKKGKKERGGRGEPPKALRQRKESQVRD